MRKFPTTTLLAAGLMVSACATTPGARLGSELPGSTLRVELPNGMTTLLTFNADGSVIGAGPGGQATGQWTVAGEQICLEWPRQGRECYPYAQPFRRGQTLSLTGTSGATVRVTMQ